MLVTVMLSHAGDGAAEVNWPWRDVDAEPCLRWCYRVMLATALPGRLGPGVMQMSSHAGDNATES
jgi:hypothetical protein